MTMLFPLPELLMIGLFGANVIALVAHQVRPMRVPVRSARRPNP
jgi:hypothetical protein